MKRALPLINLGGVLLLAALCAFQWHINRQVNLEANRLEKTRLEQAAKIEDQEKTIRGNLADLELFRDQLQTAAATLKETEKKLRVTQRVVAQLTQERDQLKESIVRWSEAVAARDEQLKEAASQIQSLADDRNAAVSKFNDLAEKYNSVVGDLNNRTRDFNELVEKYNTLAGGGRKASSE